MPERESLDADAVAHLRAAVLVLSRRLRQQAPGDISATELAVLARVKRNGPQTPGALARAEHVQPPSMTRIVERLLDGGHLRRDPHPNDGRQQLISITATGEAFLEETRQRRNLWLSAQIEQLSAAEQRALAAAVPTLQHLAEIP